MRDTNNQNNNTNNNIALIRDALGKPDGCDVDFDVEESVPFYTIRPKDGQETLHINSIDIARINHLNLQFEKCVFENKILFKKFEFHINIHFRNCYFNEVVDFSNAKFKETVGFVNSIFEKRVDFKEATFNEYIYFCESTLKGSAEFSYSIFNGVVDFSGTTFEQKVLFCGSLFNKKATFNGVKFGDTESAKGYVSFSDATFKDKTEFSRAIFQYEAVFQTSHFEDVLDFDDSVFVDKVDFQAANFCNRATFNNANFQDSDFKGHVSFSNAIFDDNVEFEDAKFSQKIFFEKTHFKKDVSFSNSIFQESSFFQSNFYQNAYFYGVTFQKFPNFLQAIFHGNVSFINTELDFGFEGTRERIETLYNERDNEYDSQSNYNKKELKKYRIANELRDSFRNIKSTLIEHHSMLDASNYHKVELYCKELELEYRREEKAKNFWENLAFLLRNGKDFIDEIQLYCYRITSDHHTNLLMILNNVIFLIALFGIANLVLCLCNKICTTTISPLVETIVSIIFVGIAICFLFECCKKLIFGVVVLIDICALLIICTFQPHLAFVVVLICYMVLISFVLFGCAICCSDKICACEIKKCIFAFSYLMVLCMTFTTPASILPILGKLIENKSGEACLLVIGKVKILCCGAASFTPETLNLIYMLFLFLLLWSLQKTARKNTIVPN